MSYNIGQIKYNDLTFPDDVYVPVSLDDPKGFYELDTAEGYNLQRLVYRGLNLQKNVAYFMRIYIKKQRDTEQRITINLRNENNTLLQKCKIFTIAPLDFNIENDDKAPLTNPKQWTYLDFIFIPNQAGYTKICFELPELLAINNKIIKAQVTTFNQITNLLNTKVKEKHNVNTVIKIGVQSRPGTIMCINGEEIRIGKTGFYEINSGVEINYFGFGAELKDFIFDYVYDMDAILREGGTS